MDIDPRWVSTPVGAAIGIVLTRKLLKPEERTTGRTVLGGVLGGAGGYAVGSFMEGEPWSMAPGKDRATNIRNYIKRMTTHPETGPMSRSEGAMSDSLVPPFPAKEDRIRTNVARSHAADLLEYKRRSVRIAVLERAAAVPGLNEKNRQAILNAIQQNQAIAAEHEKKLKIFQGWKTIPKTVWPALVGAWQDVRGHK